MHELRVQMHELRVQVQSYEFKSMSYKFKSTSYEFKSTSYEFKSTSYEFKSEFEFENGGIRRVSETTLAAKIITNQINQQCNILFQKSEIKMARSKRSNGNKASNIETQNNAPTSSPD